MQPTYQGLRMCPCELDGGGWRFGCDVIVKPHTMGIATLMSILSGIRMRHVISD